MVLCDLMVLTVTVGHAKYFKIIILLLLLQKPRKDEPSARFCSNLPPQ